MKTTRFGWLLAAVLTVCAGGAFTSAGAQAPAGAPTGATGICKDGTYSTAAAKSGACRGHKGVQTWYAAASTSQSGSMPAPTPMQSGAAAKPAPTPMAAPVAGAPAPTGAVTPKSKGPAANAAARTAAPGGGPGLVWVNTESNVYHCFGDTYYGKTKAGAYMSEADAKAKGAKGVRGKSCSK